MFELIVLGIAGFGGYTQARRFVREKLRFVDSAHKPAAKFVAGAAATAVAVPIVAVLPLIGTVTAIGFGVSVGLGVAHGSKDNPRLSP
jgi:hypothetical protein